MNDKILGFFFFLFTCVCAYVKNPVLFFSITASAVIVFILIFVIELYDDDFVVCSMEDEELPDRVSEKLNLLILSGFGIFIYLVCVIYEIIGKLQVQV